MNPYFIGAEQDAAPVQPSPVPGKSTPRLGFGCAMLMSRLDRTESMRLLAQAYDLGITHFDVARLYGYGEAEGVLGEFLKKHRCKVTVTTKVGILPPRNTALLTVAKAAARKLVKLSPSLRTKFRAKAESMTASGRFDLPTVTRSFETSLRELRTEYVDYLLLHECTINELNSPELLEFLQTMRQHGKVRQFGLATDIVTTGEAVKRHPNYTAVLQFPSSAQDKNIRKLFPSTNRLVITHSALGACLNKMYERLQHQPAAANKFSKTLGIDIQNKSELARLLIRHAMTENPDGIVLFSSTSSQNISGNQQAASEGPLSPDEFAAVDAFFGNSSIAIGFPTRVGHGQ